MSSEIYDLIKSAKPEELPLPPPVQDHASLVVFTALKGHVYLAADHLLNPAISDSITDVIGQICRQLHLEILNSDLGKNEDIVKLSRAYDLLVEIALNLVGIERLWSGVSEDDRYRALEIIISELEALEDIEKKKYDNKPIAKSVIKLKIEDMKKVMAGDPKRVGMVAWMGERIEKRLNWDKPTISFVRESKKEIEENAYYRMTIQGLCRFGNDYALGLRWLRRLGYVQVSTNPQLAAIAYRDDPSLWEKFKEYLRSHPELLENLEEKGDELAMAATLIALWPNMEVFRPVAYLLDFNDGMISYQLNPNVADNVDESVKDALKIYDLCEKYFAKYDEYLLWGWPRTIERKRPNIVFKVAGSSPAAIDITRILESLGIGTNNTVTYTVAQEAQLILAKIEGRAEAKRRGLKVTKVYETNMGGRLEGHLREVKAAELIREALSHFDNPEEKLAELAKKLGVPEVEVGKVWKGPSGWGFDIEAKTLDEKIELVSSRAYLRPLTKEAFAEFLAEAGVCGGTKEEVMECLNVWEEAIGMAGTLVAQRVWWLFFSDENWHKWIGYIVKKYGVTPEDAEEILGNIDVLPASKRKPMDTYLTLSSRNMTNTEFPNHQLNVHKLYLENKLRLEDYAESITWTHDSKYVEILSKMEDFRKAYELTPELIKIFKEVGIDVEDWGTGGTRPEDWVKFGSQIKTMKGFKNAYNKFKDQCIKIALEVKEELKK